MVNNGLKTWSKEAMKNRAKRVDEVAKKPVSYSNKRKRIDAIQEDFVRY